MPFISGLGYLSVLLAAALAAWATYTEIATFVTPITLCAMASFVLGSIKILADRGKYARQYDYLFVAFILVEASTLFWALTLDGWYNMIFWWFICFSCYMGCRLFVVSPNGMKWVVVFATIGAAITYVMLGQKVMDDSGVTGRYAVEGQNSNFTAYVLSGTVFMSLVYITIAKTNYIYRVIAHVVNVFIFYAVFVLDTRGAMISIVLCYSIYLFKRTLTRSVTIALSAALIAASIFVSLGLLDAILSFFDSFSTRSTGDLSGRMVIWESANAFISDHPFMGIGLGAFLALNGVGSHNLLLTILLDSGLFGLVVFCLLIATFVRQVASREHGETGARLLLMFVAYWAPIVFSGHWELSPFSWIVVGYTLNASNFNSGSIFVAAAQIDRPMVQLERGRRI